MTNYQIINYIQKHKNSGKCQNFIRLALPRCDV